MEFCAKPVLRFRFTDYRNSTDLEVSTSTPDSSHDHIGLILASRRIEMCTHVLMCAHGTYRRPPTVIMGKISISFDK